MGIVIVVCIIVLYAYLATEFQKIAQMKGYEGMKYFWIPFLFAPIAGYLYIMALPDKGQQQIQQTQLQSINYDSLPKL